MADIVLATLNAKYIHASFGLRYLLANLGRWQSRAVLLEFDLQPRPLAIVERLLQECPRIVGFGVYIWNVSATTEVVALLKRLRPEVKVVLGGPEVSHEVEGQAVVEWADHVIAGEADLAFAALCCTLLEGGSPPPKFITAPLPDLATIELPYAGYGPEDLERRVVYVEASRGCPFACEFCLSSLDVPVRAFALGRFLQAMEGLLQRGLQHFKFVDRTFNLNGSASRAILEFFRERYRPGLFLHFEMVPDRLPDPLRTVIAAFPPGSLQFEVGLQTFNPDVAARIQRRQDYPRAEANLRWLRESTGVHVHADLIAGLPGETLESFGAGFDRLLALRPHEIQVGILKRLRGTPIGRHDAEWGMVYSPLPPYEILENRLIDFGSMQRVRRLAQSWDRVANSGNFLRTTPRLWAGKDSAFAGFLEFSDWLHARLGRQHAIALAHLVENLFVFLTEQRGQSQAAVAADLAADYADGGHGEVPEPVRQHLPAGGESPRQPGRRSRARTRRQQRHESGLVPGAE